MKTAGKLANKVALVTGAGIGIGREVALELARQGANVALSYHRSDRGAFTAVDKVRAMGRRAMAFHSDLTKVEECFALVDGVTDRMGRVDILVNNAGVTLFRDYFDVTEADFDALYGLNIRGQFFCAQQAARSMREHEGGVIINVMSVHSFAGFRGSSVYAGTKGAILAWTRELAVELAPYHIRVVGVAPGAIEVPRYNELKDYTPEAMGARIPWGRVGQPADVAKAIAFLASDEADFVVGATLTIDGGTLAQMALDLDDMLET
jgi:NAD(P)-dependent dehydrogenase (short-subunit alcohol dehydrogenase family)